VLGIFRIERAALEAAVSDRFLVDLAGPVRFRVEEWKGSSLLRAIISSPPHDVDGDAAAGWDETAAT
jgi:hypothetical protein